MAEIENKLIRDFANEASSVADDDYLALDGATNGTRKFKGSSVALRSDANISCHVITTNPEYVYAVTDSNGVFLFGVKADGSVDWQKGVPDAIKAEFENISALISAEQTRAESAENAEVTRAQAAETAEEARAKAAESAEEARATSAEASKVDKEEGKVLINETFANGVSVIVNDEYTFAITDSNGALLLGIKKDGSLEFVNKEKIKFRVYESVSSAAINVNGEDKFFTMGFYEAGDGGASFYKVVDTLDEGETVNGMDILQLGNLQYAKLLHDSYIKLEQLGAKSDSSFDVSPLIMRAGEIGAPNISLLSKTYYINSVCTPATGTSINGCNGSNFIVNTSWGFACENRSLTFKNFSIYSGRTNGNLDSNHRAFNSSSYDADANHYSYVFENLYISGFGYGFNLWGSIKWLIFVKNVRCRECGIGFAVTNGFDIDIVTYYSDHCLTAGFKSIGYCTIHFKSCNFGTIGTPAVLAVTESGGSVVVNQAANFIFTDCNFEYDSYPEEGCSGGFFSVGDDYLTCNAIFENNVFTIGTSVTSNVYSIAFNDKSTAYFVGNLWRINSNYSENFFNPDKTPKKAVGSLTFSKNINLPKPNYDVSLLPCVVDNENGVVIPFCESANSFKENFLENCSDGTLVFDKETKNILVVSNGSLKTVQIV